MIDQFLNETDSRLSAIVKLVYFLGLPGFMVLFFLAQSAGFIPSIQHENNKLILENRTYLQQGLASAARHEASTKMQTYIMRVNCMNQSTTDEGRNRCMSSP